MSHFSVKCRELANNRSSKTERTAEERGAGGLSMKWGVVVAGLRGLTLYIVRDILYNTDVITAIVKLIVCSPVGKVV